MKNGTSENFGGTWNVQSNVQNPAVAPTISGREYRSEFREFRDFRGAHFGATLPHFGAILSESELPQARFCYPSNTFALPGISREFGEFESRMLPKLDSRSFALFKKGFV